MDFINYDYSYNTTYINKTIGNDAYYKYDFCRVFLCKEYDDKVIKIQESILKKFKSNERFNAILKALNEKNFNLPIPMDETTKFCFLFNYDYFHYTHKCLQDLFKTENILDINYNNLLNLLKK